MRHAFSPGPLENRAGFPLLHNLAIFFSTFFYLFEVLKSVHLFSTEQHAETEMKAHCWLGMQPCAPTGWQVRHWDTEFGAGSDQLQPLERGESRGLQFIFATGALLNV